MTDDPFLSVIEAAKYLSLHPQTLNKIRWKNLGPSYVKIVNKIMYRKSDLDAYITKNTITPTETMVESEYQYTADLTGEAE